MKKILYSLGEGLTQGQIEIMHQETLKLIETVGLKVPHEGIVKRLFRRERCKGGKKQDEVRWVFSRKVSKRAFLP